MKRGKTDECFEPVLIIDAARHDLALCIKTFGYQVILKVILACAISDQRNTRRETLVPKHVMGGPIAKTTREPDADGTSVNHAVFHDVQRRVDSEYAGLISSQANIIYNILRAVRCKLNTETEAIDVAVLNSYTVRA